MEQPWLGDLPTMDINYLPTGMILQVVQVGNLTRGRLEETCICIKIGDGLVNLLPALTANLSPENKPKSQKGS